MTQCCHQERQFEISKEDHINIQLAEAVGVRHLAVSYPQVPVCQYTVDTQCGGGNSDPGHQLHAGPGHSGLGAAEGLHQRERARVQVGDGN